MSRPTSTLSDTTRNLDSSGRPADDALPRRLGFWSAVAVLVGSTIGSGIFRVPSTVAADVGTVGAMIMLWVLGAVIALFGALTLAELAALFPRSGGIYVFLREAYGPLPAFLFGWTELLVIRPSALGGIAMLFAEYVQTFVPITEAGVKMVAAGAILTLATANILSVKWGALVQNASTLAKAVTLVGLAAAAFLLGDGSAGAFASPVEWSPTTWGGFGIALVAVMWAYDGWADLTFMAGEVKDPARVLPRALLGGTAAVIAIYLAVNAAYLYVLPVSEMAGRPLVAADAARKVFGQAGAAIVAAMVMLSAFGALNGSTMTGPRIFYAMADDGLFFRPIAAVHPRFRTPFAAIALAAALGIGYVSIRSFEQLADAFILGIWPFYALAVGAVFLLRRRRPDLERPYRAWGYPVVPLVFLLASVAMLANAVVEEPGQTLFGFGVIVLGIPVFWFWKRRGPTQAPVR
ncbi:MAG TPA: amino acid permease [Longimicrobiaceae bacterium]|nr:amino acid permease [Longimicrobiaceae bacterium]